MTLLRLSTVHFLGFKRFTDATFIEIPSTARLVVLCGPNGSGKSSFFDGLKTWHGSQGSPGFGADETYMHKVGTEPMGWTSRVSVGLHDDLPDGDARKRMVYIRTAFRNEADFNVSSIQRLASPLDTSRTSRLIDNDVSVSENYQRLILQTVDGVYNEDLPEGLTRAELRDRIIGRVRTAMLSVFDELVLTGVGGIGRGGSPDGTFYFRKGDSDRFLYKNLSAGEKAAFDLILDTVIKSEFYNDTIWCIDEPETHLNTRVQARLLTTLVDLLPPECQLLLASHSIGFMRRAWEMKRADPGAVTFIDFEGVDFDSTVVLRPVEPTRDFWARTLEIALGDLASLVGPERVVLCEGRPTRGGTDRRAEFDAACYRRIFAQEFPETDFISVGNAVDAGTDRLEFGRAINAISAGTEVVKLIDRDHRSDAQVDELKDAGVRVLSRRHLESFLLDDEVLVALCRASGQPERAQEAITCRDLQLTASVERGNDPDDLKSAAPSTAAALRKLLQLSAAGNDWNAFARDTLAPLVVPGMDVYRVLREDLFGPSV